MNKLTNLHCEKVSENTPRLSDKEMNQLILDLTGWNTHQKESELRLYKVFEFKDFDQAAVFTSKVAQIAGEEDHHPAILTEWGRVTVTWWTHKIKGLHKNDFIMAAKTDQLYVK
jgi:4a-hydroxytetrahydrobiopterin dehydratase